MLTRLHPSRLRVWLALATAICVPMFASGAIADESQPASNAGFDMAIQHGAVKHTPRADAYAPIGVMGGHHPHRGLMLSYRYTQMGMEGNLLGDDGVPRPKQSLNQQCTVVIEQGTVT